MSLTVFIPFVLNFGSMLQRIVTEFSYLTDKSRKPNRSCFFSHGTLERYVVGLPLLLFKTVYVYC